MTGIEGVLSGPGMPRVWGRCISGTKLLSPDAPTAEESCWWRPAGNPVGLPRRCRACIPKKSEASVGGDCIPKRFPDRGVRRPDWPQVQEGCGLGSGGRGTCPRGQGRCTATGSLGIDRRHARRRVALILSRIRGIFRPPNTTPTKPFRHQRRWTKNHLSPELPTAPAAAAPFW